jgi:hypothetical protein
MPDPAVKQCRQNPHHMQTVEKLATVSRRASKLQVQLNGELSKERHVKKIIAMICGCDDA